MLEDYGALYHCSDEFVQVAAQVVLAHSSARLVNVACLAPSSVPLWVFQPRLVELFGTSWWAALGSTM